MEDLILTYAVPCQVGFPIQPFAAHDSEDELGHLGHLVCLERDCEEQAAPPGVCGGGISDQMAS